MYKKKEFETLEDIYSNLKLEDLPNEQIPDFTIPNWLPLKLKEKLKEEVRLLTTIKTNLDLRFPVDMYMQELGYFKKYIIAFTDESLKDLWTSLYNISEDKTLSLAREIMSMENYYGGAIGLYNKHKNEIKSCKKLLNNAKKLMDSMEEYQCHYFGHMLQENHQEIYELLEEFYTNTENDLKDFENEMGGLEDYASDLWPVSREYNSDNALPIYCIRALTIFFMSNFNKPMYSYTEQLVNTIFDTEFIENEIIKHAKYAKEFLSENS